MTEEGTGRSNAGEPDADRSDGRPSDDLVTRTAAEAAEGVVFSRYRRSSLRDLDVTVTFEDGVLDLDVYLNPPEDADPDPEAVVAAAIDAAEAAVDELLEP